MRLVLVLVLVLGLPLAEAAPAEQWRTRRIYQVVTDRFARTVPAGTPTPCASDLSQWCGGTFDGLRAQLAPYVGGMGFTGLWISPVAPQAVGGYHGYWMRALNGTDPHFGSPEDLVNLVDSAHRQSMWMMADQVHNHMGCPSCHGCGGCNQITAGSVGLLSPFNRVGDFHRLCLIANFSNQTQVELCRLDNLPDLNQSVPWVAQTLIAWSRGQVHTFGFDAVRLDTVPEVDPAYWARVNAEALGDQGTFSIGEVDNPSVAYNARYQGPLDATLNYPMFWTLRSVFATRSSPMTALLAQRKAERAAFRDPSVLGTFVDNQDQPRFLSQQPDRWLYRNALAWVLLAEGIPIIYYGSEQELDGGAVPSNREPLWLAAGGGYNMSAPLYRFVATINEAVDRWSLSSCPHVDLVAEPTLYAFARCDALIVLTNVGQDGGRVDTHIRALPSSWTRGTRVCNIFYPNKDCVTVSAQGMLPIFLDHGECKIYHPVHVHPVPSVSPI